MQEKKRSYNSDTRDAQAVRTRSQILEAAQKLFKTDGFDEVTIHKIADAANVSMPTIYALFKSKRGLMQALIDTALPPQEFEALVNASMLEKSPQKRLGITAKIARQIYDAEKDQADIMRGAAVVSPDLKKLEQEREKRRYLRQEEYVKKLQKEKFLAQGLTEAKARDILWALTGRDLYRMLVIERKWSSDEYEKWLAKTLAQSLLDINV